MGVIIFNDISSEDYGIVVEHPPAYDFPEKDYTSVHIPGRNGDVMIDNNSYKNTVRTYELAIGDQNLQFGIQANKIAEWLHSGSGYCRLEDSYEPDIFRMACYKDAGNFENIFDHMGRGTVSFDCKPQRFYKSGEKFISLESASEVIKNPTFFNAQPMIIISGSGGTISVNGVEVALLTATSALVIDSDIQDAYEFDAYGNYQNANNKISTPNGFPILIPGDNSIVVSGGINSVEVMPRWWTI